MLWFLAVVAFVVILVWALKPRGEGAASGVLPRRRYIKEFTAMTYSDGNGRGMTLWDTAASEPIPWREWKDVTEGQLVSVRVVGAQRYHAEELQLPVFEPGQEVKLVPEPDNPHDPNAVAVFDAEGVHHVGYIPREWANAVSLLTKGESRAFVVWETLDGGRRVGLRIAIATARIDQFARTMQKVQGVGYDNP